jgi:hypothetical protein
MRINAWRRHSATSRLCRIAACWVMSASILLSVRLCR